MTLKEEELDMSNWMEDSDRKFREEQRELNYDTLKEVGKILALWLVAMCFFSIL